MSGATERGIWQIAGRLARRSYSDEMLRYGVALIAPGDAGRWVPGRDDTPAGGGQVRRFATEVNTHDILLLRTGSRRIVAVGLVAGPYEYLDVFDDVSGLDLQHARRVRWFQLPAEYDFDEEVFGPMPAALSRVSAPTVRDYVERFVNSPPTAWQNAPLPSLPQEEPPLESAPPSIQGLIAQAQDLYPLFASDRTFGEQPTEDELVAHFVVPLLRSLGWPVECIAIKWRRIDVALFSSLPRSTVNCRFVIEAKRLTAGVDGALEQAQRYAFELGSPRDIVVTDGLRYRLYDSAHDYAPMAYANLARPKRSALEFFERLSRR